MKGELTLFDNDFFRPVTGHGRAWTPMPQFPDLGKLFDEVFTFHDPNAVGEDTVRVIDIADLEKRDVTVTSEGRTVTVKGEYSSDIDATRIYEQFQLPIDKTVKTVQFVKGQHSNKLVFVFESILQESNNVENLTISE